MKKFIGTKIIKATKMTAGQAVRNNYNTGNVDRGINDPGYEVEYEDGYKTWSPRKAFESAYRECSQLNFGLAIEALKKGCKIARKGWNGKGLTLELQLPDEHSKMTLPYIYIKYPSTPASESAPSNHINACVPWLASQTDILADDWEIVE